MVAPRRRGVAAVLVVLIFAFLPSGVAHAWEVDAPSLNEECTAVIHHVFATGLELPGNFWVVCPDDDLPFWGNTVWNGTQGYVALNLRSINDWGVSAEFVFAHEVCHTHQIEDGTSADPDVEARADTCAASYGFTGP
jgi:hypothetical protein